MLQVELTNIEDMYNSCKTTITSAINLLHTNPSFKGQSQSHMCCRRGLLPFSRCHQMAYGNCNYKVVNSIKTRINQLIATQSSQQETLVHVISILNITRYAAQVNRHSINILMDKVDDTSHEINNLYNLTMSLATSVSFHQLILHIRSVSANLCDSLNYIQRVSTHTTDYINAATSGTLSLHILPVMDLQKMLLHISDTQPPILPFPVSPDNTLHFYRYLCTHILIINKQFLLLIDVPTQDRSQQITIKEVFTLNIPHGNFSAHYNINTKYLGITKDETMAVEVSSTKFQVCQAVNGNFVAYLHLFSH